MKREVICLNDQVIWQGPAQKIPEELKIRGFSGDGYVTVFSYRRRGIHEIAGKNDKRAAKTAETK